MEKTSKRLQAMIGLNPVRYCHIHGKHNCQDCIDCWVSEGIQADKELIAVQATEIEKLKSSIKDYQDACAQKQEIIYGLTAQVMEQDKEINRLEALHEWQPIESLPNNVILDVLVIRDLATSHAKRRACNVQRINGRWYGADAPSKQLKEYVTHWMWPPKAPVNKHD